MTRRVLSLKRHEGWLMIDHRASPGIPADIAIKLGLDPKQVAGGRLMEAATLTCNHCGNAWKKNPLRTRPREYCKLCDHYICDRCGRLRTHAGYVHRTKEALFAAAMTSASRGEMFDPNSPKSVSIIVP
jgi:hypothetical protein